MASGNLGKWCGGNDADHQLALFLRWSVGSLSNSFLKKNRGLFDQKEKYTFSGTNPPPAPPSKFWKVVNNKVAVKETTKTGFLMIEEIIIQLKH